MADGQGDSEFCEREIVSAQGHRKLGFGSHGQVASDGLETDLRNPKECCHVLVLDLLPFLCAIVIVSSVLHDLAVVLSETDVTKFCHVLADALFQTADHGLVEVE